MLSLLVNKSGPDFIGWRMVAVAFFVDFIAVGFFFYSYGVFFKAIATEFGDSRLGVSIGTTVTMGVATLMGEIIFQLCFGRTAFYMESISTSVVQVLI